MNIMLASVYERIKEIGLRRALGATHQDIVLQFLIEAVLVSTIGGLLGVFPGYCSGKCYLHGGGDSYRDFMVVYFIIVWGGGVYRPGVRDFPSQKARKSIRVKH